MNKEWREAARDWLTRNPPPKGWRGTPLQWAELEMTIFSVWAYKLRKMRRAQP